MSFQKSFQNIAYPADVCACACVCVCPWIHIHRQWCHVHTCSSSMCVCVFQMRRHVRPMFLSSQLLKFIYDSITFVATRIAIAYLGFPFLVLELRPVLEIYRYLVHSDVFVQSYCCLLKIVNSYYMTVIISVCLIDTCEMIVKQNYRLLYDVPWQVQLS